MRRVKVSKLLAPGWRSFAQIRDERYSTVGGDGAGAGELLLMFGKGG